MRFLDLELSLYWVETLRNIGIGQMYFVHRELDDHESPLGWNWGGILEADREMYVWHSCVCAIVGVQLVGPAKDTMYRCHIAILCKKN